MNDPTRDPNPSDKPKETENQIVDPSIKPPTNENLPDPILESDRDSGIDHPGGAAIGATSGGVAGAAIGKSVGGKLGAVVGAIGGAVAGAAVGNEVGEYSNPSPRHVVHLRDEEAAFVWKLQYQGASGFVWNLCPKSPV